MVDVGKVRTWKGVKKNVKWRPWEMPWNEAVRELYLSDGAFTRDEIYARSGVGRAGVTRWDSNRWPVFIAKHRSIIIQVMKNFVESGRYSYHKDMGKSDEEIWDEMMQNAFSEGYYPVWADPHRRPGDLGIYKLFDFDGFAELLMRGVRAGIRRAVNVAETRYLPAKDVFPSIAAKAKIAIGGVESRPVLTDGTPELVRIECQECGKIFATQRGFASHYSQRHGEPIEAE